VVTDVYIWCYALLKVHDRKEKEQSCANNITHSARIIYNVSDVGNNAEKLSISSDFYTPPEFNSPR